MHAFIDESGQRARSAKSSAHFVMTAVVVRDEDLPEVPAMLAKLRVDLNRQPGNPLAWKNIKQHPQRLHVSQSLGAADWLTVSSVVVCKPYLTGDPLDDDRTYLYTLRYLLERLSWLARDNGRVLNYTMAHIVRFKIAKLRVYEAKLRAEPGCRIEWPWLDPRGGQIDQPSRLEELQLADLAASATGAAFNADDFGNTETRYLRQLAPRLYRRNGNLLSYGLKLHPSGETTKAAYPWVAAL
ncbi:hypothetical protein CNX65_01370 [Actinosynnema pretiosum]|uniref:DUF3800 domain-containing protein n=2 Tax=Actinosynnema pretiosum TaxID=42197 RepID=A0A290YZD7_9PSEU|nr:hypothetical protein CNX65_01370 [Actinosynnema pretiosum]